MMARVRYKFNQLEDCLGSVGGSFGVHLSVGVYVGHWISVERGGGGLLVFVVVCWGYIESMVV